MGYLNHNKMKFSLIFVLLIFSGVAIVSGISSTSNEITNPIDQKSNTIDNGIENNIHDNVNNNNQITHENINSKISEPKLSETEIKNKIQNFKDQSIGNDNNQDLELPPYLESYSSLLSKLGPEPTGYNINTAADTGLVKTDNNRMEIVVKYSEINSDRISQFESVYNAKILKIYDQGKYFTAELPIQYLSLNFDNTNFLLSSFSWVEYAEPNYYYHVDYIPNDTYYADQWSPSKISLESAWDTQLGNRSIKVAVIDTGIDYNHPDISNNYLPLGYDWYNNDADPMDDAGHGTHVAGTIAAAINNNIGVAGVANVSIFAEKFLDRYGYGSDADAAAAINHAVTQGADILSNSWGGTTSSTTLQTAITDAVNAGVIVIAAAGNDGNNALHYPAAYPGVFTVGATDENDNIASFSNYGSWVDISAPGVNILSTLPNDTYGYYSGTSMATPHVSGLAALLMSEFSTYNATQIEQLLVSSADDLGTPGKDDYFGFGRINASRAMYGLQDHEIIAGFSAPTVFPVNVTTQISTYALNYGKNNESNLVLTLNINGTDVMQQNIPLLTVGNSSIFVYDFLPDKIADYVVNVTVSTVSGEVILDNNQIIKVLSAIPEQYDIRTGDYFGYLDSYLNPYTVGWKIENRINQTTYNVTQQLFLAYGAPLEVTNSTFNVYTGELDGDYFPFLASTKDWQVGDWVNIFGTTIELGYVQEITTLSYFGANIQVYNVTYTLGSVYYEIQRGVAFRVDEAGTLINLGFTNMIDDNVAFRDIALKAELFGAEPNVVHSYITLVMNPGTNSESFDVSLKIDGVVVTSIPVTVDPGMFQTIFLNWTYTTPGTYQVEVVADSLTGETTFLDNSVSAMIEVATLHDYYSHEISFQWEDMTGATTYNATNLTTDNPLKLNIPFTFRMYNRYFDSLYLYNIGKLSFQNEMMFLGGSTDYPTFDPMSFHTLATFMDSSTDTVSISVKESTTNVVIQFTNVTNGLQQGDIQVILYDTGIMRTYYNLTGSMSYVGIGVNRGLGDFGTNLYDPTLNLTNYAVEYIYNFVNPELDVSIEPIRPVLVNAIAKMNVTVKNLANIDSGTVDYSLYVNGTLKHQFTISVNALSSNTYIEYYSPTTLGLYNITVVVGESPNEAILENNVATMYFAAQSKDILFSYILVSAYDYNNYSAISGVTVLLFNSLNELVDTQFTDIYGQVNFTGLDTDTYLITVNKAGYYGRQKTLDLINDRQGYFTSFYMHFSFDHTLNFANLVDSQSVSDELLDVQLNADNSSSIDYINLYVDNNYLTTVYDVIFLWPLLKNGTQTLKVEVFWVYGATKNATINLNVQNLNPTINLTVGDYFNYLEVKDSYGIIYTYDYNYTVIGKIDQTTYNITLDYTKYDAQGNILIHYDFYMVTSTLNGYIIDSNSTWEYQQLFPIAGFNPSLGTVDGQKTVNYSFDTIFTVNGSAIFDNYPTTTAGYQITYNSNYWISHSMYIRNETGLIAYINYEFDYYGDFYRVNYTLVDTNIMHTAFIPIIEGNPTEIVAQGSASKVIWNINDNNLQNYSLFINGVLNSTGLLSTNVFEFYTISLPLGEYDLELYVQDFDGNTVSYMTHLTVYDANPAIITTGGDLTIELGSTGNSVAWDITDNNANSYQVFLDGALIDTGVWNSGQISIPIDTSTLGTFNYTILLVDSYNIQSSSTVYVTIEDTSIPVISHPGDISVDAAIVDAEVSWDVSDFSSGWYEIYVDWNIVDNGNWNDGDTISFSLDALAFRVDPYIIMINVTDSSGNSITDQVKVTITDSFAPSITHPADVIFEESTTGNSIIWGVYDVSSGTYEITVDSTTVALGSWESGDAISFNLDDLTANNSPYTVLINLTDSSGNSVIDEVIVTVNPVDTIPTTPTDTALPTTNTGTENSTGDNSPKPKAGFLSTMDFFIVAFSISFVTLVIRRKRSS